MIVVHINIFASKGSTGNIISSIVKESAENGIVSYVIYGRGEIERKRNYIKASSEAIMKLQSLQSKLTGNYYGGCWWSTRSILKVLDELKPDVVHLHSVNGYTVNIPRLLNYLKQHNIQTIITLHAEFLYTGNCSHAYSCLKWTKECGNCNKKISTKPVSYFFERSNKNWNDFERAYDGFDKLTLVAVSPWVKERASKSPFFQGKNIELILNGVNTEIFSNKNKTVHLAGDRKTVFYVTPDFRDELKGGRYVLALADMLKSEKIDILMVGKHFPQNLPSNIKSIDYVETKEELAELYRRADVTLLLSKGETFSMVCAESLCCGTPVVGFCSGGPESIALTDSTHFVEYGNLDKLKDAILDILGNGIDEEIANKAKQKYGAERMAKEYVALYKKVIK